MCVPEGVSMCLKRLHHFHRSRHASLVITFPYPLRSCAAKLECTNLVLCSPDRRGGKRRIWSHSGADAGRGVDTNSVTTPHDECFTTYDEYRCVISFRNQNSRKQSLLSSILFFEVLRVCLVPFGDRIFAILLNIAWKAAEVRAKRRIQ